VTIAPCPALSPKARNVILETPLVGVRPAGGGGGGGCIASPVRAEDLVDAATLGVGAQAVRVRARASAAWANAAPGLRAGSYLVQVVYPGGLTAATSSPVRVTVADRTPPALAVKAGATATDGSVCVYPRRAGAPSACAALAKVVALAKDNCSTGQALRTAFGACSGCASSGSSASKACVVVGTRAVARVSATDRAGNAATLDVPIVAYKDRASVPAGVPCAAV
jgi:hypothetical protein